MEINILASGADKKHFKEKNDLQEHKYKKEALKNRN